MARKENPISPEQIKEVRGDMSQEDLARKLEIRATTISRWERGISSPNQYYDMLMKKLAEEAVDKKRFESWRKVWQK
jgi:DNA-binding transcriptional regulator YiaG